MPIRPISQSLHAGLYRISIAILLSAAPAYAQQNDASPQSVWTTLSELLQRREYGSAVELLDSLADNPDLKGETTRIEADKRVVLGLQAFEKLVSNEIRKLATDQPILIGGSQYTFLRHEKDDSGEWVVFKTSSTATEKRMLVSAMPSSAWLKFAAPALDSLGNKSLTLGVFLAFDRNPDFKSARKWLDDSASAGSDVSEWLKRLESAEEAKKRRLVDASGKSVNDELLGDWRLVIGKGKAKKTVNIEFKKSGRTNAAGSSWTKNSEGTYRVKMGNGTVASVQVSGDRIWGKLTNGKSVTGVREPK